jgi:small GTP-binding protein
MLLKISVKTITLLAGESGTATNQIAFIQFPNYSLSTLVYLFGIPKKEVRGSNEAVSIALLIKDKFSSLFHVNMGEIEIDLKDLSEKIIEYELKKNESPEELILEFFNEIDEKIRIFKKHQLTTFKVRDTGDREIEDNFQEKKYKLAIVGDSSVGKTAILLRFCEEAFRDIYIATNGANVNMKSFEFGDEKIRAILNIWDISGQKEYLQMNEKLIHGSDAIIFSFDLTRVDSFKKINFWYNWVLEKIGYKIGVLVGNKLDLKERKITKEDAKNLAKKLRLGYIETSSKTGTNINLLFKNITKALMKLYKNI